MKLSKINLVNSILTALFLSLVSLTNLSAQTTFFDQDDAFIMGNSQAAPLADSGVTGETTGKTTSGGGCLYKWNCTNWSECFPSGKQTRNCINIGDCPSTYKSPEIEQNCNYTSPQKVEKETGTGEMGEEKFGDEIAGDNNKIFLYLAIALIIGFVIFYLKKDYFKRLIKNNLALHWKDVY